MDFTSVASTSGRSHIAVGRLLTPRLLPQRPFYSLPRTNTTRNPSQTYRSSNKADQPTSSPVADSLDSPPTKMSSLMAPNMKKVDPYRAAGQRLERLLAGVGDGEEELLNMMIMQENVDRKVFIALVAGVGISAASSFACWVFGLDPAGGASLSVGSLKAAAIGGAAALPLVYFKASLWSDSARKALPFLEEVQQRQIEEFQPILYQLNPAQTLLVMGSEVIPSLLILLPTSLGGCQKLLEMYLSLGGDDNPGPWPAAVSVSIAALLVAAAKLVELTPSEEEYATVKDALDNADRYYTLVSQGRDSSAADAIANADAFRAVAVTWLARRQVAARFAAILTTLEVVFLGGLWHLTQDFAAPLVAGLASAAVDFAEVRKTMVSPSQEGDGPAQGPSLF